MIVLNVVGCAQRSRVREKVAPLKPQSAAAGFCVGLALEGSPEAFKRLGAIKTQFNTLDASEKPYWPDPLVKQAAVEGAHSKSYVARLNNPWNALYDRSTELRVMEARIGLIKQAGKAEQFKDDLSFLEDTASALKTKIATDLAKLELLAKHAMQAPRGKAEVYKDRAKAFPDTRWVYFADAKSLDESTMDRLQAFWQKEGEAINNAAQAKLFEDYGKGLISSDDDLDGPVPDPTAPTKATDPVEATKKATTVVDPLEPAKPVASSAEGSASVKPVAKSEGGGASAKPVVKSEGGGASVKPASTELDDPTIKPSMLRKSLIAAAIVAGAGAMVYANRESIEKQLAASSEEESDEEDYLGLASCP